ncbi:MAG: 50S ribosomal protein L27 [Chloroflexota bacterium]|nr:50S ribosomal protein L27 [Chloroflexota bacterium]
MAHKKSSGVGGAGRDSRSKRLGVKKFGSEWVQPGHIIIRQRGTRIHPGRNVGMGKDHTIFSKIEGFVKFEHMRGGRKKVSVYPSSSRVST